MNAQLGKDCVAYRIQDSKTICVKDIISNKTYEINLTGNNKEVISYSPFAVGREIFFMARAPEDSQNYIMKFDVDSKSLASVATFNSDDAPLKLQLRNGSLYWMQLTKSKTNDYSSDVWGASYTQQPPNNEKTYREQIEENVDELVGRINKTA